MLGFFFKEALANISRNKWLTLAAVSTIIFTLAICGLFFVIALNMNSILKNWKEDITVLVYLKEDSKDKEINKLEKYLKKVEHVAATKLVSKKEAFKNFSEQSSEIKALLSGFDPSILPASIEITIKEEFQKSDILGSWFKRLKEFKCVDEISYDKNLLDKLSYIVSVLRVVGFIVGVFLCVASVFIISNTIKLSVYERKEEIEIMELIGATRAFIKIPFLFEGLIEGLLGSIISLLILFFSFKYVEAKLFDPMKIFIGSSDITFMPFSYLLMFLFGGILIGTLGGLLASGKTFKMDIKTYQA